MKSKELIKTGHPQEEVLHKPSKTVIFPLTAEVIQCVNDLMATFSALESPYGKPAGLAAPQIGYSWRIIIFQRAKEALARRKYVVGEEWPPTVIINASYSPLIEKGKLKDWEGCYSVPDYMGEVKRYYAVRVNGFKLDGQPINIIAEGHLAVVLQHEIDHTLGTLFTDIINPHARQGSISKWQPIREQEFLEWKKEEEEQFTIKSRL